MIYVHAKMMIIDDKYIIIGSTNINERSMDGGRDTEITMGAYQPYHLAATEQPVRGQIHRFRMSVWYEHLGVVDDAFLQPGSVECMQKANSMAARDWELYASEGTPYRDLPGHLLGYATAVSRLCPGWCTFQTPRLLSLVPNLNTFPLSLRHDLLCYK